MSETLLEAIENFVNLAVQARLGRTTTQETAELEKLNGYLRSAIDGATQGHRSTQHKLSLAEEIDEVETTQGPALKPAAKISPKFPQQMENANSYTTRNARQNSDQNIRGREIQILGKELDNSNDLSMNKAGFSSTVDRASADLLYSDAQAMGLDGSFVITSVTNIQVHGDTVSIPDQSQDQHIEDFPATQITVDTAFQYSPGDDNLGPKTIPMRPLTYSIQEEAPRPECTDIIHLLSGRVLKGFVENFDASLKTVKLLLRTPNNNIESVDISEVLVIFFGGRPGESQSTPTGQRLVLTLSNERKLSGMSPDYKAGGRSLTVIPDIRRSGIDRVWIPAWSVKTIELG